MKKLIPIIIIAVIAYIGYSSVKGFYNKTIELEETIEQQWANVESSYQRRADLIPNLMKVAERYAKFEQETFTKVVEARSKATSIQIDPSNITPEQLKQFQQAQSGLTSALSKLLAVFERYPDLKANENYKEMMNELERTENRINVERNRFNKFPGNLLAGFFGFDKKERFEAEAGTEKAPDINDYLSE